MPHNGLKIYRVLALLAFLALDGCGAGHFARPTEGPTGTSSNVNPGPVAATDPLSDARKLITEKNWPKALATLRSLIEGRAFNTLTLEVQYRALSSAGRVAVDHGPPKLGYEYLGRVLSMPQAEYGDWLGRLRAADELGKEDDSVAALTALMQRWPDHIGEFNPDYILKVINDARKLRSGARLSLLQALHDAHWKLKWDVEPSTVWRDLALLLIDKNRITDALEVAGHVTDVYVLISMHADRRFDTMVAENPELFDVAAAAEREFHKFQALAEKTPQSLELRSRVIELLIRQQHYEGALAASDSILLDIRSTNFPGKLFQDFDEKNAAFLSLRALALQRVGRWDEAAAQLSEASVVLRKDNSEVDQLIDLGDLYCSLGRPNEALSTINKVGARTSPYGAMQLEAVRADAAYQLSDLKQVERSLQFLRVHRADAPGAFVNALISVNRLDGATRELVFELMDSERRQEALLNVQTFAAAPGTPRDLNWDSRRREVITKSAVQEAIRKVGRVESYTMEGR
jgi:hypothetical protein